jgi:DNA polymerase-3 subunit alpha
MTYIALHCHSAFSILDGLSKCKDIAKRCVELNLSACALTDHGNICGAIKFSEELKKKGIKPILGCELYICEHHSSIQSDANSDLQHLVVLAKNLTGYKDLLKIISKSNSKDSFYKKPRLSLQELKELNSGNLIGISGHLGSHMSTCMFDNIKDVANLKDLSEIRLHLKKPIDQILTEQANILIDIFGKDNFFLEIQLIDQDNLPINKVIAAGLRYIGKKLNIPRVATPDAHYCKKEDAIDQRLLLCNNFRTTITEVYSKIKSGEKTPLTSFFNSSNYHIPSFEEISLVNTKDEIENTLKIGEMCEEYDITLPPSIPLFKKTNGLSAIEYLRQEIKRGFENKKSKIEEVCKRKNLTIDDYRKRYKYEESIIINAENNLEHYFLIVQDIVKFAKNSGQMVGCGRGSAGGCLLSYLLDITDVDPLEYNLLFERFYNSSRKKSLPDIDVDFEAGKRNLIIDYIKQTYGEDYVIRIATFGQMKCKVALKDVLRNNNIDFNIANEITKHLVDEAKISDQLQEIHDEGDDDYTALDWNVDYNDKIKPYCYRNDDGTLGGDYAQHFEQAIRLNECIRNVGVHSCGVAISNIPIKEVCPMIRAKDGNLVAGYGKDIEQVSLVKMDILSLNTLDKLHIVTDLINEREKNETI